ncbi:hypothetical protein H0X06_07255, partial [Candidatus Dependentiae bacterium]|nr:hypothetical protein [Candidatus Dependentiae bacterium]
MENSKDCRGTTTSVAFQLLWMTISTVVIWGLIIYESKGFRSFDREPQLLPIVPEKALAFGGSPAVVTVGLNISNFSVFDVLTNDFAFAGTLWFEFDPSLTSLDTVKKIVFEKGEILSISEPYIKIDGRKLFVTYDIRVRKKENLSYVFFPFSGHRIHVIIDNIATPGEIVFVSSTENFKLGHGLSVSGWRVDSKNVETGYSLSELKTGDARKVIYHPRVVFSIDFALGG